jgi:hypothetical protein
MHMISKMFTKRLKNEKSELIKLQTEDQIKLFKKNLKKRANEKLNEIVTDVIEDKDDESEYSTDTVS